MSDPSKSTDRFTFQKEHYENRLAEKGETPSEAYLDFFDKIVDDHKHKFDDPRTHKNNLEYDLVTTDWILEKARTSETYAQNLYAALCNNDFQKRELWPILKEETWGCSWRAAGGIVADMLQKGDYIDWYCSGIRGSPLGGAEDETTWDQKGYVGEGMVTEEIQNDLFKLGWLVVKSND